MRNVFINLEVPMYVCSEPAEPNKTTDKEYHPIFMGPVKALPPGEYSFLKKNLWQYLLDFTAWDTIDIQGPMTILEIIQYFQKKYGVKLSIISLSSAVLYITYMPEPTN